MRLERSRTRLSALEIVPSGKGAGDFELREHYSQVGRDCAVRDELFQKEQVVFENSLEAGVA